MMNNFVRLVVGILGSICSLLMYSAPIITFKRVIKNRSTECFSGMPYAMALFNCLNGTLYGSPLISNGWDNVTVMVVNGIGLLLQCCFVCIYLTFAPPKTKRKMGRVLMGVMLVFGIIVVTCFCAIHDHKHKKVMVGTAATVSSVILYASPLSILRLVIKTKSVEFMPTFYFSLFIFLTSALWIFYGVLSRDVIIMAASSLGVPFGLGQMLLYCFYRDSKSRPVEDTKVDADKHPESMNEKREEDKTRCLSDDIEMS